MKTIVSLALAATFPFLCASVHSDDFFRGFAEGFLEGSARCAPKTIEHNRTDVGVAEAPTSELSSIDSTTLPTKQPTTSAPSSAPTPPTAAPTPPTAAPTSSPATAAPTSAPTTTQPVNNGTKDALLEIFGAMDGRNWRDKSGWDNPLSDPCIDKWRGIQCTSEGFQDGGQRVTKLDLAKNLVAGTIPSSIADLTDLNFLILHNNKIGGTLPEEIAALTALKAIDLHKNNITGTIPPGLGALTSLWGLNFEKNAISGDLPIEIGSMTSLKILRLANNNLLSGTIPRNIGELTKLRSLKLQACSISGEIPTELGLLTSLNLLRLDGNKIRGRIPTELGLLTKLRNLDISATNISEVLPTELGRLTRLWSLNLSHTHIGGNRGLPSQYGKLASIRSLDLHSITNLKRGSTIPSEWSSNFARLEYLDLSNLGLGGGLPPAWADREPKSCAFELINGLKFAAGEQRRHYGDPFLLSNFLPTKRALVKLRTLILRGNELNASAGETLEIVSTLPNLVNLDLGNNSLTGDISKKNFYAFLWTEWKSEEEFNYTRDDQNLLALLDTCTTVEGGGNDEEPIAQVVAIPTFEGDPNAWVVAIPTFRKLVVLKLDNNRITGLPTDWKDECQAIETAKALAVVDVSSNHLNSKVDTSWANLLSLHLNDNNFTVTYEVPDFVEVQDLGSGIGLYVDGKNCFCSGIKRRDTIGDYWKIDPSYYNYSEGCMCMKGYGGQNCECRACPVGKKSSSDEVMCVDCPGESSTNSVGSSQCSVCKEDTCNGHGRCYLDSSDELGETFTCECDTLYLLSGDRCEAPVLLMILIIVGLAVVVLLSGTAYFNRHLLRQKHYAFVQQSRNFVELQAQAEEDMEYLRNTWLIDEDHCVFERVVASGAGGKGRWLSHSVAIKALYHLPSDDDDYLEQSGFDDVEVQIMVRLRHPRVCLFFGCGRFRENGQRFIVVEWCERGALFDVIHDSKCSKPWTWRLRAALDSAEGIAYLHAWGLVHRDIKSLNILVDSERRCKVSDFGGSRVYSVRRNIARQMHSADALGQTSRSSNQNHSGGHSDGRSTSSAEDLHSVSIDDGSDSLGLATTITGTAKWNAPELYNERRAQLSPETDVYSLAVVFWELLTLREPWREKRALSAWNAVSRGSRPRISKSDRANAPEEFVDLLEECWRQEPSSRPCIAAVVERLELILNEQEESFGRGSLPPSFRSHVSQSSRQQSSALRNASTVLADLWKRPISDTSDSSGIQ